ncbi:hypothetical protein [Campylobacter gracilis]|nr:hypothetical protein [Campylobacter gracilis]
MNDLMAVYFYSSRNIIFHIRRRSSEFIKAAFTFNHNAQYR